MNTPIIRNRLDQGTERWASRPATRGGTMRTRMLYAARTDKVWNLRREDQ